MDLLKLKRSNQEGEINPENFISFNFFLVKGKLSDPKTLRLLLVLAFLLVGNISAEKIPFLKNLIEIIKHLIRTRQMSLHPPPDSFTLSATRTT